MGGVTGNLALLLFIIMVSFHLPHLALSFGIAGLFQLILIASNLWPCTIRGIRSDGGMLLDMRRSSPSLRSLTHGAATGLVPSLTDQPSEEIEPGILQELAFQLFRPDRAQELWAAMDAATVLRDILRRTKLPVGEHALVITTLLSMEQTAIRTGASPNQLLAWSTELTELIGIERTGFSLPGTALIISGQINTGQAMLEAAFAKPQSLVDCAVTCAWLAVAAVAQADERAAIRWMNELRSLPRDNDLNSLIPRLEAKLVEARTQAGVKGSSAIGTSISMEPA